MSKSSTVRLNGSVSSQSGVEDQPATASTTWLPASLSTSEPLRSVSAPSCQSDPYLRREQHHDHLLRTADRPDAVDL